MAAAEAFAMIFVMSMFTGGVLLIIWLVMRSRKHTRELAHKERMAALEMGKDIPLDMNLDHRPRNPLKSGLTFAFLGIGMVVGFIMGGGLEAIGWGVMVAMLGLANIVWWFLGGKDEYRTRRRLNEELTEAYIQKLRGNGGSSHSSTIAS